MGGAAWRRALALAGGTALGMADWAGMPAAQGAVPATPGCAEGMHRSDESGLEAGRIVRGCVPVDGHYIFRLDVPAGHVVQGQFDGRNAVLDLQDEQGRHVRRLGRADATSQSMMWVVPDAPQQLVVRSA